MPTTNRQKFIEFLARDKYAAEFFINLISKSSNVLDMDFIEQHGDQLDWDCLSNNESLPWSESFIDRYKDKWKWGFGGLSENESLPWSEKLIERFADKWDWHYLSGNESLPWSESLVVRFEPRP